MRCRRSSAVTKLPPGSGQSAPFRLPRTWSSHGLFWGQRPVRARVLCIWKKRSRSTRTAPRQKKDWTGQGSGWRKKLYRILHWSSRTLWHAPRKTPWQAQGEAFNLPICNLPTSDRLNLNQHQGQPQVAPFGWHLPSFRSLFL